MKKYNLLKILLIGTFIVAALSWVIPASTVSSGAISSSKLNPIGVIDLFRIFTLTLTHYLSFGLFVLSVGAFYGVLNKVGGYQNLVKFYVDYFKKEPRNFLIISFVIFMFLSAIGGNHFVLLLLVPFFITVLLKIKYSKIVAMFATFGAIVFGNFASIYGFEVSGYLNYYLGLDVNYNIIVKIVLFLATLLVVYFTSNALGVLEKGSKEEKNIPLYIDVKDKKSFWPVAIVIDLLVLFLLVATYNWRFGINTEFFIDIHDKVLDFELLGIPVFQSMIGKLDAIGFYSLNEATLIVLAVTVGLALFNKIGVDEYIDSVLYGVKEVAKPAFFVVIASIVMSAATFTSPTFLNTLVYYVAELFRDSALVVAVFLPLLAGVFTNSLSAFISTFADTITSVIGNNDNNFIIALGFQMYHSALMLILPTSLAIVAGITYLDISFKDWMKFISKYVYALFALAFTFLVILTIFL